MFTPTAKALFRATKVFRKDAFLTRVTETEFFMSFRFPINLVTYFYCEIVRGGGRETLKNLKSLHGVQMKQDHIFFLFRCKNFHKNLSHKYLLKMVFSCFFTFLFQLVIINNLSDN